MGTKKPFYLRLRPDLMTVLRQASHQKGMTMTKIIERALEREIGPTSANVVNLKDHMQDNEDGSEKQI